MINIYFNIYKLFLGGANNITFAYSYIILILKNKLSGAIFQK